MSIVVVWFCHSSSLAFLISAYLINVMHQFLLQWVIFFGGCLFVHTPVFFLKNTWIFCVFASVPHLVDNYAKIVDERGRNFMCDRTIPSQSLRLLMIDETKSFVTIEHTLLVSSNHAILTFTILKFLTFTSIVVQLYWFQLILNSLYISMHFLSVIWLESLVLSCYVIRWIFFYILIIVYNT